MDASSGEQIPQVEAEDFGVPAHENSIMDDPASRPGTLSGTSTDGISLSSKPDQDRKQGVLLNAEREVRIKLYMGQVSISLRSENEQILILSRSLWVGYGSFRHFICHILHPKHKMPIEQRLRRFDFHAKTLISL